MFSLKTPLSGGGEEGKGRDTFDMDVLSDVASVSLFGNEDIIFSGFPFKDFVVGNVGSILNLDLVSPFPNLPETKGKEYFPCQPLVCFFLPIAVQYGSQV